MITKTIEKTARKICTHHIVYTDLETASVAAQAVQGLSTKAIAADLHITVGQTQYRISKAQNGLSTRFRADYRNGNGALTKQMLAATRGIALNFVRHKVAPLFAPFAAPGVPRVSGF